MNVKNIVWIDLQPPPPLQHKKKFILTPTYLIILIHNSCSV